MLDRSESPPLIDRLSPPRQNVSVSTGHFRPISREIPKLGGRLGKIRLSDGRDPQIDPELESLENDIEQLRNEGRQLREESGKLEEGIRELMRKLDEREKRQEELQRITKELAIAQRFLSTADSLPQAEVVQAMEVLNEEIFQLTSIVADTIQVEEKTTPSEKNVETYQRRLARFLNPAFFLEVIAPKTLDDSLAIQIGWQAILARWCSGVIQRWMLAESDEVNDELVRIYRGIVNNNGQAVAGRWRAIARRTLQKTFPVKSARLVELAIGGLTALPILCGYIRSKREYDDLVGTFQPRIGQLLEKCLNFRKMVGEGFTSVDIEPYLYGSGEQYDPKYADLEYEGEESTEKRGLIACSLSMGLYRTYKAKDEDGNVTESREQILKPKVILRETLIDIIS